MIVVGLDLGPDEDLLVLLPAGVGGLGDKPDKLSARSGDELVGTVALLGLDDLDLATDVLANLADVSGFLATTVGAGIFIAKLGARDVVGSRDLGHRDGMAATVVGTAAGAGAVVALGVEAAGVALMLLAVGALDLGELEPAMAVGAASHDLAVADVDGGTAANGVVGLLDVGGSGEDGVVAVLAASQEVAHNYSIAASQPA